MLKTSVIPTNTTFCTKSKVMNKKNAFIMIHPLPKKMGIKMVFMPVERIFGWNPFNIRANMA